MDKFRSTRSQKTNNATHLQQSRSFKTFKPLNSMHHTENHHRNVLSPELDLVSQNQLEEYLKKETSKLCLHHISK